MLLIFCISIIEAQRRPVIGISDLYKDDNSSAVPRSYVDAVLQVGGLPVVIPLMYDDEKIVELLNSLDGIIFTGGEDFDPSYYNERPIPQMGKINAPRDEFDINLLRLAVKQGVPVLGICRGIQLINIVYGGSLYQDLSAQYHDNSIRHRQRQPKEDASHSVLVEDNTVFADIVKERMLMVNSSHHQAIKKVAPGFRVAGQSPDKIVEVIEKIDSDSWILGVQFHPEVRFTKDFAMRRIFQRFVDEASRVEMSGRRNRTLVAQRPLSKPEPAPEQKLQSQSQSQSSSYQPRTINKPADDTQYIYKYIVDTQYVYKSIDTIYLSVIDTIYFPLDNVAEAASGTPEIVYGKTKPASGMEKTISAPEKPTSDNIKPVTDTMIFTPGIPPATKKITKSDYSETKNVGTNEKEVKEKAVTKETAKVEEVGGKNSVKAIMAEQKKAQKDTETAEKEAAKAAKVVEKESVKAMMEEQKSLQKAIEAAEKEKLKAAKTAEKEAARTAKAAEKEAAKIAKVAQKAVENVQKAAEKAARKDKEEKEQQYRQEQIERAKLNKKEKKEKEDQKKKEQKELKEKEKQAKKEAEEKEKQLKSEQKESEKSDKKALKAKETQEKKELKEKEEQEKKEAKDKEKSSVE